jgi:hypothetical protein
MHANVLKLMQGEDLVHPLKVSLEDLYNGKVTLQSNFNYTH